MTTRKIGVSTFRSTNNTGKVLRHLERRAEAAAKAMAVEAQRQAQSIFSSDGDGTWDANSSATIAWKGHEKVMLGRTGALSDGVDIRFAALGHRAVGWFGDDHPDSDLTKASLAWEHERDRPWLSRVDDNPVRAEAVFNAGRRAYLGAY